MKRGTGVFLAALMCVLTVPRVQAETDLDLILDKLVEKNVISGVEAGLIRKEAEESKEVNNAMLAKDVVPSWAMKWSWSGDMRLRYELFKYWTTSSKDYDRYRERFRVGVKAKVGDDMTAAFRLATGSVGFYWTTPLTSTGNTNNPGDPVSTNQTMDNTADKKLIYIDQMFLTWNNSTFVPVSVLGGKFENPFWGMPLVWDGDLTLEGAAVSVTPSLGPVSMWMTSGFFPLYAGKKLADNPSLIGSQAGFQWRVMEGADLELLNALTVKSACGYYDYRNMQLVGVPTHGTASFGNTVTSKSGVSPVTFKYGFSEVDCLMEIGSSFMAVPFSLYGDWAQNVVCEAQELRYGYLAGVKLGKVTGAWSWELNGFHERLQSDAVFGQFADSDFGPGGTNRFGNVIGLTVGMPVSGSTLGLKWFENDTVTTISSTTSKGITTIRYLDDKIGRLQADWVTKF